MNEDGGGTKRLPENPVILENAPWYFTVWFIGKLTVCQPIAASNVNNRQSRFTQNKFGSNTGSPLNVLELNTGHMCFQNNQQANGIEGKQQSENVQELIKNRNYNLGQKSWENCILGKYFSKHRSCTGSFLSPFPWKQCCRVFKRKPDPWAFVGSNIELGEGVFFPQRRRFGNSFVA